MPTLRLALAPLALAATLVAVPPALAATAPAAPAAKESAPSADRASRQMSFLDEYLAAHPAGKIGGPADLDRSYAELEAAWAKTLQQPDPVLARFDPYVTIDLMLRLTGPKLPPWTFCHVWEQQLVPRFLADFEVLAAGPPAGSARLLSWGTINNLIGPEGHCKPERARWDALYAAVQRLPGILDTYLAGSADGSESTLRQVRGFVLERAPQLAFVDLLQKRDVATARQELAAKAPGSQDLALLGLGLADLYVERRELGEALAVLDLVARSTTPFALADETLRAAYEKADPQGGPERFARAKATRLPILVPSEERIALAGRFEDLGTGRSVDLASLSGKLVLLDFWTSWCVPCLAEVPQINDLLAKHGKDGKLAIVGIASDANAMGTEKEKVRELVRKKGMKYLTLYDSKEGSWTERLEVHSWPTHVLIGPDGKVLAPPSSSRRRVYLQEVEAFLAAQGAGPAGDEARGGRPDL